METAFCGLCADGCGAELKQALRSFGRGSGCGCGMEGGDGSEREGKRRGANKGLDVGEEEGAECCDGERLRVGGGLCRCVVFDGEFGGAKVDE